MYNAHTTHWQSIQCDGRISAGCWVTDGSKVIVATGSDIKVSNAVLVIVSKSHALPFNTMFNIVLYWNDKRHCEGWACGDSEPKPSFIFVYVTHPIQQKVHLVYF